MTKIFIYSDQASLAGEITAAVKEFGREACAFSLTDADAQEMIAYGAEKVFLLKGDSIRPEDYARTMAAIVSEQSPEAFILGATIRGREMAPRIAGILGCALVSEASRIDFLDGLVETDRSMYGGAAVLTERAKGFAVITLAAGKYEASKDEARTGEIIVLQAETDRRVKRVKCEAIVREGVDITKAARIVCVGMGFDKKEDLAIARNLARALGAELAATRPITEDRKWLPPETYIGISGAVIKPDLYIGLGVSGQIQHVYGIRDARIVVGINNNEKAPMFQAADYAILGDLYEVTPLLAEEVKKIG